MNLSLTVIRESSTVKHDLVALEPKEFSHHFFPFLSSVLSALWSSTRCDCQRPMELSNGKASQSGGVNLQDRVQVQSALREENLHGSDVHKS